MRRATVARLAGGAALLLAACATDPVHLTEGQRARREAANKGLSDWQNVSSTMMVEKYGPPDRMETMRLVWENRGPWKRIEVWDELGFLENDRASSNLEQTIAYPVPADKREALESFSRGLHVSADGAELSSRSTGEDRNFLALNLADEIAKGLLSPQDARAVYLRTIQLSEAGKSSPSMQHLLFQ